jgi:hypothetical protein
MGHGRSLGKNQANTTLRPTAVVVANLGIWNTIGGELARHGRHHNAISQLQFRMVKRLEQYLRAQGFSHLWSLVRNWSVLDEYYLLRAALLIRVFLDTKV